MKNYKLILLAGIILVILTSCSNDDLIYSCDKNINSHVKKNLLEYSSISRDEWLELPDTLKVPVYRTFSPEKKYVFWEQKRDELLELEWSDEERQFIVELYDYILSNPQVFEPDYFENEEYLSAFQDFVSEWYSSVKEVLYWNDLVVYYVAFTGNKYGSPVPDNHYHDGDGGGGGPLSPDCSCNTIQDFCDPNSYGTGLSCKTKYPCELKAGGCGWFFTQKCNGMCYGNFV